jgi:bifunctional lysine-specific demethylase and histidyl-hydroxylase NO66
VYRFDGTQRLNFFGHGEADGVTEDKPHEVACTSTVWKLFAQGWSVRILHPQRWCDRLCGVMSRLEDFFGQGIGCNAYLTPPASQGFAPHWDDIDAFIVQLEGSKRCGFPSLTCQAHNFRAINCIIRLQQRVHDSCELFDCNLAFF